MRVRDIPVELRSRRWSPAALLLLATLTAARCCASQPDSNPTTASGDRVGLQREAAVAYDVAIRGNLPEETMELLHGVSDTLALRDQPPPTMLLLQRRIDRDVEVFLASLKSRGHFGGTVEARVVSKAPREAGDAARLPELAADGVPGSQPPVEILFEVAPGPVYTLRRAEIRSALETPPATSEQRWPAPGDIGLVVGGPALTRPILDARDELRTWFGARAHPLSELQDRRVVVFHEDRAVDVALTVDPGPRAVFGEVSVEGLEGVEEGVVRRKIPWRTGEPFDSRKLHTLARNLTLSGVFATARVLQGTSVDEEGRLPVKIVVTERKHRTIEAGATYQTDIGAGGRLFWEHRNVFGGAERLSFESAVTGIGTQLAGAYRSPDLWRRDQNLVVNFRVAEDTPEAYRSRNVAASAQLERVLDLRQFIRAGVAVKFSEVDSGGVRSEFDLVSFPFEVDLDRSDAILDPRNGDRILLKLTPFHDPSGNDLTFFKLFGRYATYRPISDDESLVLAGRTAFGSIAGASRDRIPADERFFAGGGGSVRGYPFQSIGPADAPSTLGGRSLLELSLELRYRLSEQFGLVGFVDGGGAFLSELPDLGGEMLLGAGVGFRYYTAVGPLRVDLGFPLDRRPTDADFQLYVSIGQAF